MLRASVKKADGTVDCVPIGTGVIIDDCGVPFAREILAFVDAIVLGDLAEYPDARVRVELALGRDGADRVAMIAANFCMMNRLLDSIGAPVDSQHDDLAAEIGVTIPFHLRKAPIAK